MSRTAILWLVGAVLAAPTATAQVRAQVPEQATRFQPIDVFDLEWTSGMRISPDGRRLVYVRNRFSIMDDRRHSNLWLVTFDGQVHRPLTSGGEDEYSPRWSPDGERLLFVSADDENGAELYLRWMDTGQTAKLTELEHSPSGIEWSPDGEWVAFTMFVPEEREPLAQMPPKPEGADWAPPARVVRQTIYRNDGGGYAEPGHRQIFILPDEGGTPRQITFGPYDHGSLEWVPGERTIVFSANRNENPALEPLDSEIYTVSIESGRIQPLTDRYGPDSGPAVSPDGRLIAYTGFDDRHQGYQVTHLYVMNRDGSDRRTLAAELDRDIRSPVWSENGERIYFQYTNHGIGHVAYVELDGEVHDVTGSVGGLSIGRPYSGGSFTLGPDGRVAFTLSSPYHPADVAVAAPEMEEPRRLTAVNMDLLGHMQLGEVEEIWYESSYDGRRIQGWIIHPPGFDPSNEYPLILEIHGGPFSSYGPHFTPELQLYAAAGYVVLYTNPRGSTSYGEEFGNLIHHAYPGNDYHDLMSGVDAMLDRGYIDEDRLFVTGGSGGGVLSAWIVGMTDRFSAAVVQKPVINWYSWALTADMYPYGIMYWFPGYPWEFPEHYMERSPISLVGNVETPTMLLTGTKDYRTPISESEQFYQALKLQQVPAVMVRVRGASHGISARPSHMITKVVNVVAWFDKWGGSSGAVTAAED